MKRAAAVTLAALFLIVPLSGIAQIYPPAPGVEIPQAYLDRLKEDRTAFRFERAWLQKVKRIKENREAYIDQRGFFYRPLLSPAQKAELSVTGTVQAPVFMVKFANTGADPYPISTMQTKLFDGPYSPRTLTDFYDEISYGDLNMTGTVYGWTLLANNDTYYEGPAGCYGVCSSAKVGDLILETLNANDAAVDFSAYDNDGPDGVPNSGDDDGYVDFVAFIHPEVGAECGGNNNIWSHRWTLSGWIGGTGWTSNDAAASGGYIKVNDYVIQPAYNCGGATVIDIGVFCHEFGHALGLPDLYDTNGGSAGIGHWGLMGSGSWNTVANPAHVCAWSKVELGWANIIDVGSNLDPYAIDNVEFNRPVYRLNIMHERWRRMTDCAINGSYSMRCGLTAAEASARVWPGGEGYGNGWLETVSREFSYDSTNPVILSYDYAHDTELNYDYIYGRIEVLGTVSTFATYHGTNSGTANIDLTSYLNGSGASTYTVSFEFVSDVGWSDEDNNYPSTCGAFAFDDVSLIGGGENYFSGFETREDGWAADMADPSEFILVENRQALGSDVAVHGGGGLAIWHVDQDIIHSLFGNTGGPSNTYPHGVDLMQSDGLDHLGSNTNRGDDSDAYPGSTSNTLFSDASNPNSKGYNGQSSNVVVQLTSGNGDPITANMSGCWPLPVHTSHFPTDGDNDTTVTLHVYGGGFVKGAGVELVQGATVLAAPAVEWVGKDYVIAYGINLNGAPGGNYDVVVTNPCDGAVVDAAGFHVNDIGLAVQIRVPGSFALRQNYPNPFNPVTTIPFDIKDRAATTLRIYNPLGQIVRTLINETLDARSYAVEWDGRNDAGIRVSSGVYFYKLVAGEFQDVRKLVLTK